MTNDIGVPGTVDDAAQPTAVQELLARWDADADAVYAPDGTLTYGGLFAAADVVAAELHARGVRPGDPVAVCLQRSAALVIALLGVLRSGAAYVALDPAQPAPRLTAMLHDSRATVLIAASGSAATVFGATGAVPLERVGEIAGLAPVRTAELPAGLAYVMFTSGSTGRPKGVQIGHAGLSNLVRWHGSSFGVRPGVRCSQLASPGFDASAWEIWGCLANGGTLVIAPEQVKTDPAALRDWLVDNDVEVGFVPTPLAETLLALDWPAGAALRELLTGGDRLGRRPQPGLPFRLVNNYGVTEATVVATSAPVGPGEGAPPMGTAIDGVELRVVDAELFEVGAGVPGELLIGGVSLAHGYLHSPELTAAAFVTAADGTGPWYRTSDLVAQHPDGQFDHLGRIDDQVQVRGNRVEPAEVAAALVLHPDVARSVVIGVGAAGDDAHLVAFYEPLAGADVDEEGVQAHLVGRLPGHMVPSRLVRVDRLPVTSNDKIDRAALAATLDPSSDDLSPFVIAQDDGAAEGLDAVVGRIIAEVLKVDSVAPDDNFLLIGGHSLLAAQVVARLADRFDVEISLRDLFDNPSAHGLAALVEQALLTQVLALDDETAADLTQPVPG